MRLAIVAASFLALWTACAGQRSRKAEQAQKPGHPGVDQATPPAPGRFGGLVLDDETGAPLAGVTIVLLPKEGRRSYSTLTDRSGRFFFTTVPPGAYEVTLYYSTTERTEQLRIAPSAGHGAHVYRLKLPKENLIPERRDGIAGSPGDYVPHPPRTGSR